MKVPTPARRRRLNPLPRKGREGSGREGEGRKSAIDPDEATLGKNLDLVAHVPGLIHDPDHHLLDLRITGIDRVFLRTREIVKVGEEREIPADGDHPHLHAKGVDPDRLNVAIEKEQKGVITNVGAADKRTRGNEFIKEYRI